MRRHSLTGCAGDILLPRARTRGASGLQDLSVRREGESDANGLALVTQIIEHDAVGGRRDFLQPERGRHDRIEPRPPVGFKFGAAFAESDLVATALKLRVISVEIEQRRKIALPARVQPIDHQSYLIEIVCQVGRLHPDPGPRPGSRGAWRRIVIIVNGD